METIFFDDFHGKNINAHDKNTTQSTLLIPQKLIARFRKRRKLYKGTKKYFAYLLRQYRLETYSGFIPEPYKVKLEFQKSGQDLKRVNFTPENKDWIEIGILAHATGKSKALLLTILLEIDLLGFGRFLRKMGFKMGVPVLATSRLEEITTFQRITGNFGRYYQSYYAFERH
jgi:Protein of unknown function (DUF1564)